MKIVWFYLCSFALAILLVGCGQAPKADSAPKGIDTSLQKVKREGILYWGADVIGGIPYVYEDPQNAGHYIGFEMDIAKAIARHLGVTQQLVIKPWDNLVMELQGGSFDIAMNGIEDTPGREKFVLFSDPYFVYAQQITVRKETHDVSTLDDLKGRTVATLSGTAAEDILRSLPEIKVLIHPEIIFSYEALEKGQADAVLLDTPIASAYGSTNPKLKNVGKPFAKSRYVIAFRQEQKALKDAVNEALKTMKDSGELGDIYRKWGIMDSTQQELGIQ